MKFLMAVAASVMILFAAACTTNNPAGAADDESAAAYDQLLSALQGTGFNAESAGTISQPFFEPKGQLIRINDQEIQVFQFSSEAEAASAAATISPDGSAIGTSMVTWIAPPHFYHSGDIIVLYLGEDEEVLSGLQQILGAQIAGR
jgi:hypothetical protein